VPDCSAVSDEMGTVKLYTTDYFAGNLSFDHNIGGKIEHYDEVPAITLQNIMNSHDLGEIDFLKIDCEGSEGAILASTPEDYLKRIKQIAMEFHDNVSKLKHDEIMNLLQSIGFKTALRWNGQSPFGYIYAWQN
jgi:hypothetical protein